MLENLPQVGADPLWELLAEFQADKRKDKIDLLVGVYRDETGVTPVMENVKSAENQLANQAASKAYGMLSGNGTFNRNIAKFILGADNPRLHNQRTIQTVGASGALRVLADFIKRLSPNVVIWNTNPGYINHQPIMEGAGLQVSSFRWQDKGGELDINACFADLEDAVKGDVILLHASCHNPTGIDPSLEQWQQFVDFCKRKKITPFIDIAYQGFGETPEQDAAGLRLFVEQIDEVLITASCSKNMGLYCERTGAAIVMTNDEEKLAGISTLLERITRSNYSMPPNHGAAIANILFSNQEPWLEELASYRDRVNGIRQGLTDALTKLGAPSSMQVIGTQKGMFSMLPLTKDQMIALRKDHGIYGVPNGRINLAGLKQSQTEVLAKALIAVLDK
ncbi:aromatic amino acid transaminase [Marinomonas sp. C2222]|uniref:Aromatic amino acid transaminase n=1 Tax=Marinomonas sargassi TaxID=2984494 RepID=A0ABT2YUH6_9GAMM|nr:aromatic amino acid transaminase [Marinomonas sargassi]MCV2403526.1 aromatic amino acid transaminase [Marinomonas sargassi]